MDVIFVEDLELEAEPCRQLLLPLEEHRGRTADHNFPDFLAQEQLARNEASLDGFAETNVVGDEQVNAGKTERLPQGFELIGIELDARTEWRLEEFRVCGSDAVPPEGVQVRREPFRWIETSLGEALPVFAAADLGIELMFPKNVKRLALRVVIDTGQTHQRRIPDIRRCDDLFHEIEALANMNDRPRFRNCPVRNPNSSNHSKVSEKLRIARVWGRLRDQPRAGFGQMLRARN